MAKNDDEDDDNDDNDDDNVGNDYNTNNLDMKSDMNTVNFNTQDNNKITNKEAEITKYLKLPSTYTSQLGALLPGQLDVNGLISIQTSTQLLSQQATGLNEYTLGESGGSVRTLGEAMMLADSASGILNILSNKIKQQLICLIIERKKEINI